MTVVTIPEGQYACPGGVLLVKVGRNYSAVVRFVPRKATIPDEVTAFDFYFNGEDFDGSSVGFGDGLSEATLDGLPPEYRYEDVGGEEPANA